jgi:hypothetical protein
MPILKNSRHELFAQEIAKGKSASEAYQNAGYRPSRKNASRLKANEDINARVAELQAASAASAVITIESICAELDQANAVAREKGQAAAMVSASALRAKLAGLLKDRVEVGGPGDFDDCETVEAIADRMLAGPGGPVEQFRPIDERDRQGLLKLIKHWFGEFEAYIENIRQRPQVLIRCDMRDLSRPWKELELQPYEVRRLAESNGRQRKPDNHSARNLATVPFESPTASATRLMPIPLARSLRALRTLAAPSGSSSTGLRPSTLPLATARLSPA